MGVTKGRIYNGEGSEEISFGVSFTFLSCYC